MGPIIRTLSIFGFIPSFHTPGDSSNVRILEVYLPRFFIQQQKKSFCRKNQKQNSDSNSKANDTTLYIIHFLLCKSKNMSIKGTFMRASMIDLKKIAARNCNPIFFLSRKSVNHRHLINQSIILRCQTLQKM